MDFIFDNIWLKKTPELLNLIINTHNDIERDRASSAQVERQHKTLIIASVKKAWPSYLTALWGFLSHFIDTRNALIVINDHQFL